MSPELPLTRRVIRADGTEEPLPGPVTFQAIRTLIQAADLDTVNLRSFGRGPAWIMVVDDNGYETQVFQNGATTALVPVRAKKPFNEKATALYLAQCKPGTTHRIVGDVVLVMDEDYA